MADIAPTVSKQQGQSFWDANPCGGGWSRYADFLAWIQRAEPYAFEIVDRRDWAGKCVLDVGCGQGTLLNHLPDFGATMFGLDMSSASLRRAAAGANELGYSDCVHLLVADAEGLPFPDACFDAVLSFGVLHHTPDTWGGGEGTMARVEARRPGSGDAVSNWQSQVVDGPACARRFPSGGPDRW